MDAFEFPLQSVLELREREEQAAQRRLAQARRLANSIRAELRDAQARHDDVLAALRRLGPDGQSGTLPIGHVEQAHRYLNGLRQLMTDQRERLEQADRVCRQRQAEVVAAAQARRTLDQDEQYRAIRAHLPRRANAQLYVDIRPARELAMALGAARMARRARAFLPLISQSVPQLGGYALAAVSEKDSLRLEGYGDVPALFALTNIGVAGLAQKLSEAKAGAD